MEHYAGLDVSLKEISICVVDEDGGTVARGTCPADPEGVAGWFRNRDLKPRRIVHESGMLSIWLQRGMSRLDLPATSIDARKAHKSLSARLNKSDTADTEGLAQLARTGWFTPVYIRSEEADRLRSLVGARERLIRLRKDLEGHIRGVLKTFGIRMTGMGQGRLRQAFRDQLASAGEANPVLRAIADGFIAAHATLCEAEDDLGKAVKKSAKAHPVARRLMTIPGVGPISALSFIALVDDPTRFSRTSDVGAFLGLTPKRHQSGEMDWSGRVSKCGDGAMRGLLFEAASCLIRQVKRFSPLKSLAVRLAGRRGFRKAAVATARKIAVLMLTLWKNETEYQWTKEATA
ncbi:IS110 family transposase [Roseobacter sp. HKCCD9010]|uniref:IS110 family transposase n=1 Tax=unclassified Roseobacter TaxID=196798 RepID=UPI001491EBE6|nr:MULTISPECIES: IS110 family transposase [unclassified Roseobacter]MBF9052249.1 IS110 family transposase [Rhodobacterales bacterium HKCCD4356]NNV14088.1 IS110 family transposase [Roseobacter sp. HKCCD7357]NNV18409.1 IS110 family transposase [Roseobacter sp. HKCCD8768]NNV27848.1 IS110 family transposase [Roseobacter sp. HKCCD8192]NNV32160.1 IS110 family transposase [Roseobacter sp. HKCCD9061]